jgi:hypothetical protein
MKERQPSLGLLILALMATCLGIWLWPTTTSHHTESTTRALAPPANAPLPSALPARTEELRRRVLAAAAEHRRNAPAPPHTGSSADDTGDFGELGKEVRAVGKQLVSLATACHEQALERQPRLGGMLALNVHLALAEGIGGIIESVEPASGNQIGDAQLIECIRQSAFGIELPPPSASHDTNQTLTISLPARETAQASDPAPND